MTPAEEVLDYLRAEVEAERVAVFMRSYGAAQYMVDAAVAIRRGQRTATVNVLCHPPRRGVDTTASLRLQAPSK